MEWFSQRNSYLAAAAIVLSVLCCADLAFASQTTPPVSNNTAVIGVAPVGNDLSLIDIGGFLRLVGGFLGIGVAAGGADTTPPSAPTDLTAVAASLSELDLSWTASTDNVGVAGYQIYRDGSEIGTTSNATYADTGLAASSTHAYIVKAYDAAGNISSASNTATSTTGVWADGYAGAPTGPAQYPSLFTSSSAVSGISNPNAPYQVRPPWRVAGVDYRVGINTGVSLKNISTITSATAGPNFSLTATELIIDDPNITLNGWDFCNGNGGSGPCVSLVLYPGASNLLVENCNFGIGTNDNPIFNQYTGPDVVTFLYDVFDGNGREDTLNDVIFNLGAGAIVKWSVINRGPVDEFDYGINNTFEYNLVTDMGVFGGHADWIQLSGGEFGRESDR